MLNLERPSSQPNAQQPSPPSTPKSISNGQSHVKPMKHSTGRMSQYPIHPAQYHDIYLIQHTNNWDIPSLGYMNHNPISKVLIPWGYPIIRVLIFSTSLGYPDDILFRIRGFGSAISSCDVAGRWEVAFQLLTSMAQREAGGP